MGTLVFVSGGSSGSSAVRVVDVDQFFGIVGPGFITENEDGVPSVGGGDSGGPVFTLVPPSEELIGAARGIVLGIIGTSPDDCLGLAPFCSTSAFHVNMLEVMDALQVTPKTS